ncbi:MAG: hypothetical protein ABIG39_02070, partial [Candidatus Micrarchaeota archaeon]
AVMASNALAERITYVENDNRISEVTQSAMEQLTESPGDPSNWKSFDVNSVGLAESMGVLDSGKIRVFISLMGDNEGYDKARGMLSLNRQGGAHRFNLRVEGMDGVGIYSAGPETPKDVAIASASKVMLMDGRPVRLSLRVWGVERGV